MKNFIETEILQVALGHRAALSRALSDDEWNVVFKTACDHFIVGVMWDGVEKLPKEQRPYRKLVLNWFGQIDFLKSQKDACDGVMAEFGELMNREHIHYFVFKGLAVASHYSRPELRTVGDIDFYVPESDFERCVEVIERYLNVRVDRNDVDKHYAFEFKGIRFEMHYRVETFGSAEHQKYFDGLVDDCIERGGLSSFNIKDGQTIPMLPPVLDIILVFKHWMNHFVGEGVGLRQTFDLAVLVKAYQDVIGVKVLKSHLESIGYMRAFDVMVAIADRYFGIRWTGYGALDKSAYKYADRMMTDIMKNGNFGRSDYKYKVGMRKRLETAGRLFSHCARYFWLAPKDIVCLVPKRILISLKAHRSD